MDNIAYFKQAGYGLMMHFGLYSLLAGSFKGKKNPGYAEWIQCDQKISVKEIEKLAKVFNPIYFDADEICEFAKSCGMKYIVITAKHHEGFALFKSEYSKFNVVDATPFKRDIIAELSDACRRHNIKLGFYYSQCIDWYEKDGGGYNYVEKGAENVSWSNSWDYPDKENKDYDRVFNSKIYPQIKELMTNYGDVFLTWFDMPLDTPPVYSKKIYDLVKKYQPDCLVNSRLGNGMFDYVSFGDNEIPDLPPEELEKIYSSDMNSVAGFKKSPYDLYESACTLNNSWGYTTCDEGWKSPELIARNRIKLNNNGINYLINVGPDYLGRLPYQAMDILKKASDIYAKLNKK